MILDLFILIEKRSLFNKFYKENWRVLFSYFPNIQFNWKSCQSEFSTAPQYGYFCTCYPVHTSQSFVICLSPQRKKKRLTSFSKPPHYTLAYMRLLYTKLNLNPPTPTFHIFSSACVSAADSFPYNWENDPGLTWSPIQSLEETRGNKLLSPRWYWASEVSSLLSAVTVSYRLRSH